MPLQDDYQTEKLLKEIANEVAHGINDAFEELHINQTSGFVLFLLDYNTGVIQYISDMDKEDADLMMTAHIKRNQQ